MGKKLDAKQMFSEAYEDFNDAIFRHCYFRISDRERAKELTQETFMRVWEYLDGHEEVENIRVLLYKIANNLVIDEYRRKKTTSLDAMQEQGFDPQATNEAPPFQNIEIKEVLLILKNLEPKYKDLFVMRYVDDLSIKEIAELTGEKENSVSVRIHRATNQIKEFIKKHE